MKYLIATMILLVIAGCGGDSKTSTEDFMYTEYFGPEKVNSIELVRTTDIPDYKGDVGKIFTDISFDFEDKNFQLPGPKGMAQFPLAPKGINFAQSFTAPTEGYLMAGFACNPADGKITALDKKGLQFITDYPESVKIPMPSKINNPTGVCHDGKNIWVCDSSNSLHLVELNKSAKTAKVIETLASPVSSPVGICFDGHAYWVCSRQEIVRFDREGEELFRTDLPVKVDGICVVNKNIVAIAYNDPKIYMFEMSYDATLEPATPTTDTDTATSEDTAGT